MSDKMNSSTDKDQSLQDDAKAEMPGNSSTDKDQSLQDDAKAEMPGNSSTDKDQSLQDDAKAVMPGKDQHLQVVAKGAILKDSNKDKDNVQVDAIPVLPTSERKPEDIYFNVLKTFQDLSIRGFNIQATNVQVGSHQTMITSETEPLPPVCIDKKLLRPFMESTRIIKESDLPKIKSFGKNWRAIGRALKFPKYELDTIENDHSNNLTEITYQILYKWLEKFPDKCMVKDLAEILYENETSELILTLPKDE